MITHIHAMGVALVCLGLALPTALIAQETAPLNPPPDNEAAANGIQTLTRGPVHEAFAEPVSAEPAPGPISPQQPPEPIEELPAEARPDDPNAEWISGYWIWNEEDKDFLWVSGIWRSPPSGLRWVPGYWTQANDGFQRVSGFWTSATNQEVVYLPTPPESVEAGPNVPAPSADHFWVPGCWMWESGRYQWRSGHWARVQPDWLWIPAHYCWTPRGCVFINGYWDYPLASRGVIFAPVHFHQAVYSRPGFVYTPSVIINTGFLTNHFFVRPSHCHYYFGDYYGDQYTRFGIQPWFAFQNTRGWHDPIFVHQRWRHSREGDDWAQRLAANHRFFAEREDLRPRHTFTEQQRFSRELAQRDDARLPRDFIQQVTLGAAVKDVLSGKSRLGQSFERVSDDQRRELRQHVTQMRDLAQQRVQSEVKAERAGDTRARPGTDVREPGRFKLPPIANVPGKPDRPVRTADERNRIGERSRFDVTQPAAEPDRAPELPSRPEADGPRRPLPGAERQPDRIPGGTPGIGPSQSPTGPAAGTDRDRNDRTLPDTERSRTPLPGSERQPDRLPGGTPAVGPSPSPTGRGTTEADKLPADRSNQTLPSQRPSRIPLPGAERQPSRIPGGTPGIGPSQSPTTPGPEANRNVPSRDNRTLPGTTPSRDALPGGERQPNRIPGGTPGIGPSNTPSGQTAPRLKSEPGVRSTDPQRSSLPQPNVERAPETRRSQGAPDREARRPANPQPAPTRIEAQRPASPAPAPQARPAPSGGRNPAPAARSAPSGGGRAPGGVSPGGNPGGGGGNRAGGNRGQGNDKK